MAKGTTMTKEMKFVKKNGKTIRGRIYLPETTAQRLPVVIFCHGFGSNFRELMHHGDGFAEAGICCLFFDFCGGGPESLSDGTFEEMTVGTECEDLETVIDCVKELDYVDPGRIFLQGESMGGLVSALVAARRPEDIRAQVLWYPAFVVPEGAKKRYEAGKREVFGLRLGESFDREAMDIKVYEIIPAYQGAVLMIQGSHCTPWLFRKGPVRIRGCPSHCHSRRGTRLRRSRQHCRQGIFHRLFQGADVGQRGLW